MTTPNLSSLTPTDKIRLAAELDDYYYGTGQNDSEECWRKSNGNYAVEIPDYLTSYDAIIPLIQKQNNMGGLYAVMSEYLNRIQINWWYDATPSQLLDALLLATGKATI
jgi:hypothetical protein